MTAYILIAGVIQFFVTLGFLFDALLVRNTLKALRQRSRRLEKLLQGTNAKVAELEAKLEQLPDRDGIEALVKQHNAMVLDVTRLKTALSDANTSAAFFKMVRPEVRDE